MPIQFQSIQPILAVTDVGAAIAYYRDILGFSNEWLWGDPPTHGGITWGKAGFQFTLNPTLAAKIAGQEHFIRADELDSLHALHLSNGATIISPLETKPWGMREYTVRDLTGYELRFAQPASNAQPKKSKTLPPNIQIIERLPTPAEHAHLTQSVGWGPYANYDAVPPALTKSLYSVVAIDAEKVIATGRIIGDATMFLYLQDVMVHADYQGRQIGTTIVNALMSWINQNAPNRCFIGLFTGKGTARFYERYNFQGPEAALYGMSIIKSDQPIIDKI